MNMIDALEQIVAAWGITTEPLKTEGIYVYKYKGATLKTLWAREAADDLMRVQGADAGTTLAAMLLLELAKAKLTIDAEGLA